MADGPWHAAWVGAVVAALASGAIVVFLLMWDETVELNFPVPYVLSSVSYVDSPEAPTVARPFAAIWAEWHEDGPIGMAETIAGGIMVVVLAASIAAAILLLASVHEGGSVWKSYKRCLCGVQSCLGFAAMVGLGVGACVVAAQNHDERVWANAATSWYMDDLAFAVRALMPLAGVVLVAWIAWAVRGVREAQAAPVLPPRCEHCGYDLTHLPVAGQCTECGWPIRDSIDANPRATSHGWEARRSIERWIATTLAVLFRPERFYATLPLRTSDRAARAFVRPTFILIPVVSAVWFALSVIVWNTPPFPPTELPSEFIALIVALPTVTVLLTWLYYRSAAALLTTVWFVQRSLPDPRWARKIIAYESAYLWVVYAWDAVLLSSFAHYDFWISNLLEEVLGPHYRFSAAEPVALLGGTAAFFSLWLWRYTIAFRAIRWSNY